MKKIVPFKKNIEFENNLAEITSISLDHTLHLEENYIKGEFILNGEYKMTNTSVNTEKFNYNLPFEISVDSKYILDDITLDIDDFYYEIIDNNVLCINIEVLIDNLEERVIMEEEQVKELVVEEEEEPLRCVEKEITLFDDIDTTENYATYKVYIVRENDNLDEIMNKYNVTKEDLEQYNDLTEIKLGDKLIIPYNEKV